MDCCLYDWSVEGKSVVQRYSHPRCGASPGAPHPPCPSSRGSRGGKRLLVLVGQKKALGIAARNDRPQRQYSGLLFSLKSDGRAVVP
jgi:hypothetical protein